MATSSGKQYEFGDWRLDPAERLLVLQGEQIALTPKVFDTLALLVENAGSLVSKEEFMARVWPDAFVEDAVLTQNISQLRKVLGDPGAIATVPKKGYRFLMPVKALGEAGRVNLGGRNGRYAELENPPAKTVPLAGSSVVGMRKLWLGLVLTLLGLVGWGVVYFIPKRAPFEQVEITQLTTVGKVKMAAISADGKYVAYVVDEIGNGSYTWAPPQQGKESLWLRQVAGNDLQIASPAQVNYWGLTFSHDGEYLYAVSSGAEKTGLRYVYKIPVLGGNSKKLIADVASRVTLSPDGKELAFLRYGESGSKLVVTGEDGSNERTLAETGSPRFLAWGPAWSSSGRSIAAAVFDFNSAAGLAYPAEFAVRDGSENPLTNQRWEWLGDLAWLPDSRGLIVNITMRPGRANGQPSRQIGYLSYGKGEVQAITSDTNSYWGVSLTADSRYIATVQEKSSFDVWVAPLADVESARPVTSGGSSWNTTWDSNGDLVFERAKGKETNIWVMKPDGSNARQLTANAGPVNTASRVSPDGHCIIFISERSGSAHLWRMDIEGNNPKQLTNGSGDYPWLGSDFTPDGKWVVFTRIGPEGGIWRVPVDGGEAVRLNTPNDADHPAVSPDGKMLAYNSTDAGKTVVEVRWLNDGTPPKRFDIPAGTIRWTPDSRSIFYVNNDGGVSNLWRQSISGGLPEQITHFKSEVIANFDLSGDGKNLVMDRGTANRDVVLIRDLR